MGNIFRQISDRFGLTYVGRTHEDPAPPGPYDIFHNKHSVFDFPRLGTFRGLHVIRDPRDQIVSSTFYHEKSDEPWLHVKREEFGGMTYQEKMSSFSSFDDKLLFEMEHAANENITRMKEFDYSDDRFINARYEDLIEDNGLKRFEQIFKFLGFRGGAVGWCLVVSYRNSLFSGTVSSKHVRSGKSKQWPEYFKPIHKKRFEELFGDVLEQLGYSQDEQWRSM